MTEPSALQGIVGLRARYLAAQLNGDRREALRLIAAETASRALTPAQLSLGVIQEAQREIGRLWQENRITIAQEHMATAISQLALALVYRDSESAPPNGKMVLVACVAGEQHAFPAQIVADTLDLAGFGVRFLGSGVPIDSLLSMIEQLKPDLLALSCAMTFNLPALRETVLRVRQRPGPRLPILVGGNSLFFSPDLLSTLDADGSAGDAQELLARCNALLGLHGA